jgi:integrase
MNIIYNLKIGKKSNQLFLRLYESKLDISCSIGIVLDTNDWNQELQLANSSIINQKLSELKSNVLRSYNEMFMQGFVIDKTALKNIISDCFNRPTKEISQANNDMYVYYSDFAQNWLDKDSDQWKTSARKTMVKSLKKQYQDFVNLFLEFEKTLESKLILKDMTIDDFYGFANYMEEENYNNSTIKRTLSRMKFFCQRANEQGIKISSAYNQRVFVENDSDEIEGVYLNEVEVLKVYNTDFSFDPKLQTAKENLLIGIFSGLRCSDYLTNLDLKNIKDDFITITTQKTKTKVVIPVHDTIKEIIKSNFGQLPPKMNAFEFGKSIKIIGQICGFDELVFGKKWDADKKRKIVGYFKRYELFTTHIARRSMASNLYGKIPNDSILSILGWQNESMLFHYVKTSKKEHAQKLNDYWQTKN